MAALLVYFLTNFMRAVIFSFSTLSVTTFFVVRSLYNILLVSFYLAAVTLVYHCLRFFWNIFSILAIFLSTGFCCVCFLEGMGGKVFMSSVWSISSDVCQDELSAHCQSSHPCGNTYPKAVIPEGADTLLTPHLQTEWGWDPCPRAGCGPQAPSQPCSHPWGCPVTIRDNGIMGLQLHAPSSIVFTSWAFDQGYRLPHMC